MHRLRIAGALWITVAVLSLAATFIFRVDPFQIVATAALGVATAVLGAWMIALPRRVAVPASVVAGAVWLLLYLGLAVVQSDEVAAWVTDAFLAVVAISPVLLARSIQSQFDHGRSLASSR